jgi:hypothetical protein
VQPNGTGPLDYLEALKAKGRQVEVTLGGQKRTVRRARLGLALRLFDVQGSVDNLIDLVLPYVSLAAGIEEDEIQLEEAADAFRKLFEMNRAVGVAPLAMAGGGAGDIPPAFRYRGRGAAAFIHEIAHAYGWTADYILEELGPEEAWCYVQEIEQARFEEQKYAYQLSTVGRDKRGKQQPMRGPAWFQLPAGPPPRRRRTGAPRGRPPPKPTGTVIDLTGGKR